MIDKNKNEFLKSKNPKFLEEILWEIILTSKKNDTIFNLPDKIIKEPKKWKDFIKMITSIKNILLGRKLY